MRYVQRRLIAMGVIRSKANRSARRAGDPIKRETYRKFAPGTTEKPCSLCKVTKPLDAFSELKTGALGRQARCKACINAIGKSYHKTKMEGRAGRPRPDVCDACGTLPPMARALHWDHDHETNQFRGWLCHYCNTTLGRTHGSIERLQQLIAYLKRGGGPA